MDEMGWIIGGYPDWHIILHNLFPRRCSNWLVEVDKLEMGWVGLARE